MSHPSQSHVAAKSPLSAVESLESRRLMAATAYVDVATNTIWVYGTEGRDIISVKLSADRRDVVVGAGVTEGGPGATEIARYPLALIRRLNVSTYGGDDEIYTPPGTPVRMTIDAGAGDDMLLGGDLDDVLYGGDGRDELWGNGGNDYLYGNAGDDALGGAGGRDYISGGDGSDRVRYVDHSVGVTVTLGDNAWNDGFAGEGDFVASDIENADGTPFADVLVGSAGNNRLCGFGGDDHIYGMDGDDALLGYDGNDTLYGGNGADRIDGDNGDDTLDGGAGADYMRGGFGSDRFYARDGSTTDQMFGFAEGIVDDGEADWAIIDRRSYDVGGGMRLWFADGTTAIETVVTA